ncbi:eEF1A lysine and N-terminal methyltransferase homolog [Choristoneura fumiferana]|uniref:eEF1A lysine and N-terminal methyltransferase homolog n=1 Tax=Choristoneura fumiferana TaxID=7141 RepID=UPI003D156140
MNLLPKSHKEFSEKDYWNKFFKKRGNKAFEWYGEYLELCSHLHKYIKQTDNILITGCGNSGLSADLYDVGFSNITNIDVSEVAIKQMKNVNAQRTKMKFICMDALNTSFQNDEFNVVLDKGTLDALMPDDTKETNDTIDKYFSEIKRVLKLGGRFVCISLLQVHILNKLLATFCDKSWMFRVVRCHEAEEKNAENGDGTTLPVFIVIATKFKEMPVLIAEVCMAGDKMIRLKSADEVRDSVKSVQDTAFVTNGLTKTSLEGEDEVSLDLMQPGEESPRYTLYIVDQKQSQAINKYAVFIVPQGRESEWLFGTPAGRRQLQGSARFGRLVVAVLRRGHDFASLDAVKEELAQAAKMLLPNGFSGQIPFLSLGSDVGRRVTVHAGSSKVSGDFVVEDVDVEGATHRRLVFMDNQFLVQSEAKMKTVKRKNKTKLVVDFGHISLYHSFMCVGAHLAPSKMAVLGLGGGGLCMFLKKCYGTPLTAVELDPTMLDIARDHFELTLDDSLKVEIKDGVDFLKDEASSDSVKSVQDTAFVTNGLTKTSLEGEDEVSLDLMQPGEESPRYTLYIVDQKQSQAINKYAVFIVPQGRESEWLFGTPAGRRQLQGSARFGRLVVAVLRRGHDFASLDAVKEELAQAAKMLLPHGFSGQIPFLSLGSDVGRRVTVHAGSSKVSGDFVVEDVDVEGATHRRLVFMDNQFLVQSEAKMKTVKRKNKTKLVVDFGHISLYHSFMCVGAHLAPSKMAVLGLGGGGLCMFLKKCYGTPLTAVELDPTMLDIARDHFELTLDDSLKVEIKDGVDFLKDEASSGGQYSSVMFDMDSKDRTLGLSCPPRQFLADEVLGHVKKILTNDGHFILNLVCRDNDLHDTIIDALKKHFKHLVTVKLYEEVNEIVFATNGSSYSIEGLEETVKRLNAAAREKGLAKIKCVDLTDFLQSVTILS